MQCLALFSIYSLAFTAFFFSAQAHLEEPYVFSQLPLQSSQNLKPEPTEAVVAEDLPKETPFQSIFKENSVSPKRSHLQRLIAIFADLPSHEQAIAYEWLASLYLNFLEYEPRGDLRIEAFLLKEGLKNSQNQTLLGRLCYAITSRSIRPLFKKQCLHRLNRLPRDRLPPLLRHALLGFESFDQDKLKKAVIFFEKVVKEVALDGDPILYIRLAQAYELQHRRRNACEIAQKLYQKNHLLPEAQSLLQLCPQARNNKADFLEMLEEQRQQAFLAKDLLRQQQRLDDPLLLENSNNQQLRLDLSDNNTAQAIFLFQMPCQSCQNHFKRLTKGLDSQMPLHVISEQTTAFLMPPFPKNQYPLEIFYSQASAQQPVIWQKIRHQNHFSPTEPLLLIVDRQGFLRFALVAKDYEDLCQYLRWGKDWLQRPQKNSLAPEPALSEDAP